MLKLSNNTLFKFQSVIYPIFTHVNNATATMASFKLSNFQLHKITNSSSIAYLFHHETNNNINLIVRDCNT